MPLDVHYFLSPVLSVFSEWALDPYYNLWSCLLLLTAAWMDPGPVSSLYVVWDCQRALLLVSTPFCVLSSDVVGLWPGQWPSALPALCHCWLGVWFALGSSWPLLLPDTMWTFQSVWNWLGHGWWICVYPKLRELSLQIWPLKFEEETWKTKTMDEVFFR